MLRRLSVANYALIDALEMQMDTTLNIITGETGAGKSILLGALGLIIGSKSDGAAIKDNSSNCVVEGEFDISAYALRGLFEEHDWDYEPVVTLRRVITPSGKSRAFIGDIPVQLNDLKTLGARLIDIHSQHQNRKLSHESYRLASLDAVAGNSALLSEYELTYAHLVQIRRELREAELAAATLAREEEWLRFQVDEFDVLKLQEGEVQEIEAELLVLENADKISEALSLLSEVVDDENIGAIISLKGCESQMLSLSKSYPPAAEYASRLRGVIEELKDMSRSAASDGDGVSTDGNRLSKLTTRLDTIISLQQKHRVASYEELLEVQARYREQYTKIVTSDENIAILKERVLVVEKSAQAIATKLHKGREVAAKALSKDIESIIVKLGLVEAQFVVQVSKSELLTQSGCSAVEFLFSANRGKSVQSVDKIASGGEISRIMLAIKATLAKSSKLPTIIFDEIDTGVSGRIASAMGDIIAELSADMQVVDITHLPQVAAKGSTHFVVYKQASRTNIEKLSAEQRVEHIAAMLSGDAVTDAALSQARNLLNM